MSYDSAPETQKHIEAVRDLIDLVNYALHCRGREHDRSKLCELEKAVFDEFTPKLKGSTYGSDEYRGFLAEMKVALDHHYASNRHHPEHFENGIRDMNLLDIVEMFCDWLAATKRHADGDIRKSIVINQQRFGYSDDLKQIFLNTADAMETAEMMEGESII